jgi:hypothetical protein
MYLSFSIAAGPRPRIHSRVRAPWDSRPYFTVSDSRLLFLSPPTTRRATAEVFDPTPVFSIFSARTSHRKHSPSIVTWRRPHRKDVSRVRLLVDLSVSSNGRGADDIENIASSIVACWTVFRELLPSNALIKSVTLLSVLHDFTANFYAKYFLREKTL